MTNRVIFIVKLEKEEGSNNVILHYLDKESINTKKSTLLILQPEKIKGIKNASTLADFGIEDGIVELTEDIINNKKYLKGYIDDENTVYIDFDFTPKQTLQVSEEKKEIVNSNSNTEPKKEEKIVNNDKDYKKPSQSSYFANLSLIELQKNVRIFVLSSIGTLVKRKYSYAYLRDLLFAETFSDENKTKEALDIKYIKLAVAKYINEYVRHNLRGLYSAFGDLVEDKIDRAVLNLLDDLPKEELKNLDDRTKKAISKAETLINKESVVNNAIGSKTDDIAKHKIREQISISLQSLTKNNLLEIDDDDTQKDFYIVTQLNTILGAVYAHEIAIPLIRPFFSDYDNKIVNEILDELSNINKEIVKYSSDMSSSLYTRPVPF